MKRWLFAFDEEPSPAALPVVVVHLAMSARDASTLSVTNEAELFESAAAAVAQ